MLARMSPGNMAAVRAAGRRPANRARGAGLGTPGLGTAGPLETARGTGWGRGRAVLAVARMGVPVRGYFFVAAVVVAVVVAAVVVGGEGAVPAADTATVAAAGLGAAAAAAGLQMPEKISTFFELRLYL
jgi:hypothetical protein